MKKLFLFVMLLFLGLFMSSETIFAENSKKYINESEEAYVVIDKDVVNTLEDVVQYVISDYNFQKASWNEIGSWQPESVYYYTTKYDSVVTNPDKWWATLYVCKGIDWAVGGLWGSTEVGIYSSALLSRYVKDSDGFFKVLVGGTSSSCLTFTVQDVPKENQVSYCQTYETIARKIAQYADQYKSTQSISYKSKYKVELENIRQACNLALSSADYNDACVSRCLLIEEDLELWNDAFSMNNEKNECGFSNRFIAWIFNIMRWVKYIAPVLVIILGILDFIKAIGSDKDDEMKKAQSNFIKRLIAAALVFLIPLIIQFILEKMGFTYGDCGLF